MVHYGLDKSLQAKHKKVMNHNYLGKQQTKMGFCSSKLVEFCKRTDLHGYKYIVMEDLNVVERGFWVLAVSVSIVLACFFVTSVYKWYARNPIVTVIESTQGAIWDIPFPAVTICGLNVISKRAAREFANSLNLTENVTADEVFGYVKYAPQLVYKLGLDPEKRQGLFKLQKLLDLNDISIESFFRQISPASSCSQLVERCMWKNTIYRCDVLFQHVFTYFALCCSFNYFAVDTKKTSKFVREQFHLDSPRRVASCGYQTGLTVIVNTDPEDYYSATVVSLGALVFVDNAYNVPDLDSPVRLVNPSTEVLIALSPEATYTTSGFKAFRPEDRQCYYDDENMLANIMTRCRTLGGVTTLFRTFVGLTPEDAPWWSETRVEYYLVQIGDFNQYSFHNCIAYQKIKLVNTLCGCMPFYFPLKDYHRTCNFNDLDCLESISDVSEPSEEDSSHCRNCTFRCLPECEHYEYSLEIALGNIAGDVKLDGQPFFNDVNLGNRSIVNVFFNDLVSTRYRRDVYLNWQNLLASFGGLLSLMLGFTLIAGFDLILFFTFGISCGSSKSTPNDRYKQNYSKGNKIYVQEFNKDSVDTYVKKRTFVEKGFGKY